MGLIYIFGATLYILHIPERIIPEKLDILLNSHTIFHLCTFLASLSLYFTLEKAYEIRINNVCF